MVSPSRGEIACKQAPTTGGSSSRAHLSFLHDAPESVVARASRTAPRCAMQKTEMRPIITAATKSRGPSGTDVPISFQLSQRCPPDPSRSPLFSIPPDRLGSADS